MPGKSTGYVRMLSRGYPQHTRGEVRKAAQGRTSGPERKNLSFNIGASFTVYLVCEDSSYCLLNIFSVSVHYIS